MNQEINQSETSFETVWNLSETELQRAKDKLDKLNKRAQKLGIPGVEYEVGEEHIEVVVDQATGLRNEHRNSGMNLMEISRTWDFTVRGDIVGYEGWTFLARIWHIGQEPIHEDGQIHNSNGNIIEARPGAVIDKKWRTAGPDCDHCKTNRRRKDTYILKNADTDEIKQVGSTCLHDFLGVDPARLVNNAKWFGELVLFMGEFAKESQNAQMERAIPIETYLQQVAAEYYVHGFTTSREARENERCQTPTGQMVFRWFFSPPLNNSSDREYQDEMLAEMDSVQVDRLIAATLFYLGELQDQEDLNDYEHNLSVHASIDWVTERSANTVASAIKGIIRQHEKYLRSLQTAKSEHFGELKKRVDLWAVLVDEKNLGVNNQFYPPQERWIYTFVTDEGNSLKWFTSNGCLMEQWDETDDDGAIRQGELHRYQIGDRVKIRVTIRSHNEWRGVKETIINRVSFVAYKPEKKKKSRKKKVAV